MFLNVFVFLVFLAFMCLILRAIQLKRDRDMLGLTIEDWRESYVSLAEAYYGSQIRVVTLTKQLKEKSE